MGARLPRCAQTWQAVKYKCDTIVAQQLPASTVPKAWTWAGSVRHGLDWGRRRRRQRDTEQRRSGLRFDRELPARQRAKSAEQLLSVAAPAELLVPVLRRNGLPEKWPHVPAHELFVADLAVPAPLAVARANSKRRRLDARGDVSQLRLGPTARVLFGGPAWMRSDTQRRAVGPTTLAHPCPAQVAAVLPIVRLSHREHQASESRQQKEPREPPGASRQLGSARQHHGPQGATDRRRMDRGPE